MFTSKKKGHSKKNDVKAIRLNQCDMDILYILKGNMQEVITIHEKLPQYSDQEISLNLSWLEKNNLVKKIINKDPFGSTTVLYSLDSAAKQYIGK